MAVKCQPLTRSWHFLSCGSLNALHGCQKQGRIGWWCGRVLLAEEDQTEGADGVDEDPEARDELLLEGDAGLLLGRLILGQFLQFGRMRVARFHVVDETLDGGALFGSYAGVSKGAGVNPDGPRAYPFRRRQSERRCEVRRRGYAGMLVVEQCQ